MRLIPIFVILSTFFLSGCSLVPKKAGIEIMSYPPTKVFFDNKEMGVTPYKNSSLKPGEIDIKLVTNDNKEWNRKVELKNSINTVIDWEFGEKEQESGGYILYMEKTGDSKKAGLIINSSPDKAAIKLGEEIKGYTPMRLADIGEGDKQISISYPSYKNINVYVKPAFGYQLIIESKLASEIAKIEDNISKIESPESSSGASLINQKRVTIKETETGWLRVRDSASSSGTEISKVKPKEEYAYLESKDEWIKIDLGNGKSGWISKLYADIEE